jgi:hypothetical protein
MKAKTIIKTDGSRFEVLCEPSINALIYAAVRQERALIPYYVRHNIFVETQRLRTEVSRRTLDT